MHTESSILRTGLLITIFCIMLSMAACTRPTAADEEPWKANQGFVVPTKEPAGDDDPYGSNPRDPNEPVQSPTPDPPHPLPGTRKDTESYIVQPGDTLGLIAERYSVSMEVIAEASGITNINILSVGQELVIPPPDPVEPGPNFKIIPDSELIASPASASFDTADFSFGQGGYLIRYEEELDEQMYSGVQIVQMIARDFSVNPRLLLAVLEYQSGWVSNTNPRTDTLKYPLGWKDPKREGLYRQLAWAANELNRGYYLWRVAGVPTWILDDGTVVPIDPTINAGTAGVQHFFAKLFGASYWEKTVSEEGFFSVYNDFFGYPFDYTLEPVLPPDLAQPEMQLPFEDGVEWSFSGGPHGGWGNGSAWAALDFGPPGDVNCLPNDEWVVAMADGLIVRAENGAVVQDLDGDGSEQTGWTILYMHIESRDRVAVGTNLHAGSPIGHPSCEGGVTNGTHVHIARRYNGEWIPADQTIPFTMDGWVSSGSGKVYNGYLIKEGITLTADEFRISDNIIQR